MKPLEVVKILVLGRGWLGQRIVRDLPGAFFPSEIDIADREGVFQLINHTRPDVVINAAGKTGRPNVDWCETHAELTYRSNVIGALNLAEACTTLGVYFLHLGSGCIFNGPRPTQFGSYSRRWREDDYANPESFYARTKYAADLVLSQLPNVAVARLRMPIDSTPHPRNLITKLAGYKQIVDVQNSVTVVDDLLAVLHALIEQRATGIFHACNPGAVSHREIMSLYRELVDPASSPEWIRENELQSRGLAVAPRSNCVLADTRLGELGIEMRPALEAVRDVLTRYVR